MMTASRTEFLKHARAHREHDQNPRPIRVMREIGWHPSLFSYDDGSKPTIITATPIVYISYVTYMGAEVGSEVVLFREMFSGEVKEGAVHIELTGSLHDWLIANANEVMLGDDDRQYVKVYKDEPERELSYAVDRPTSLTQKA